VTERRDLRRAPIIEERVRTTRGQTFAFVPHRFLRDGFFVSLSPDELRLYLFLVLAADRYGVSFYGYESICSVLEVDVERYLEARNGLIDRDLLAFDGTRFQVLSLPSRPVGRRATALRTTADMEQHDAATVRVLLRDAFDDGDR
jgi:hypothetical protein